MSSDYAASAYIDDEDDRPVVDRPHSVYRLFDAEGRLLYIGHTRAVNLRVYLHDGYWSNPTSLKFKGLVAHVESEEHPSKDAARDAEMRAIGKEAPMFNVIYNQGRHISREQYDAQYVERNRRAS